MGALAAVLAVSAGAAVVGGIVQYYQAEKARGANQKELNRIREMFERLVPPEYDLSPDTPPQYIEEALKGANLDFSRLTPEEFKVVGQYAPEAAAYVAEANPTLVQGSAAAKEGRGAQQEALREYLKMARGESPELQIRLAEASRNAQGDAQARSQSALSDAQRRGVSGGGLEFASQLQGASDSNMRGAMQGQQAAIAAYQAKMDAIRESGGMGRQLAQDELSQEQTNANIINQFNQRTSRNYQDYLNQQAAMANEAQRLNLGQAQDTANANTAQRNDAARYNQQNQNQLATQQYGMQRDERNYKNTLAESKAVWAANDKKRINDLKARGYQDQLGRTQGMAGIGYRQMDMNTQNGQDKNALVQSMGNAAQGMAGSYYQHERANEMQNREDARWDKYFKNQQPSYGSNSVNWDEEERNKFRGLS